MPTIVIDSGSGVGTGADTVAEFTLRSQNVPAKSPSTSENPEVNEALFIVARVGKTVEGVVPGELYDSRRSSGLPIAMPPPLSPKLIVKAPLNTLKRFGPDVMVCNNPPVLSKMLRFTLV